MKRTFTILAFAIAFMILGSSSVCAKVFKSLYKGTIAGKNVRVELYVDNSNYSVWGSYYYLNSKGKKISGTMNINGTCNPIGPERNPYHLTESYNGAYTGTWETNLNANNGKMTGVITNSKGNTYSINLREL